MSVLLKDSLICKKNSNLLQSFQCLFLLILWCVMLVLDLCLVIIYKMIVSMLCLCWVTHT